MAIPYSRPTLPGGAKPPGLKIPAPPKGGGIWGPATRQQALKTPKPKVAANDQFMLNDPYAPGKINSLATSGYNTDTANAQKLAAMGYPTDASVGADYAARGTQANGIQQALAAHLAGVQGVDVAQGNAGSAALGAQNAATQATAPHIAGAPAMPGLPTGAAQAVLGSQTAAAGNYDSALQAAALSTGATAEQNANNAGLVAQQGNQQSIQKTLASLLSGVEPISKRSSDMVTANQSVDAANIQTGLGIYTADETAKTAAIAAGNKQAYDSAVLKERADEARMSNKTRVTLGIGAQKTSAANAALGAKTSTANTTANNVAAGQRTQAQIDAANKRAREANIAKGLTAAGKPAKNYKVTVLMPATSTYDANSGKTVIKKAYRTQKTVPAAVWNRFNSSGPMGKRKFAILGVPEGSKIQSSTGY